MGMSRGNEIYPPSGNHEGFKKISAILLCIGVMSMTAGCGGGGGGSSGAAPGVAATPPQTAMWTMMMARGAEEFVSQLATTTNINTHNQAFLTNQKTTCSNGGSLSASGSLSSINFAASNCLTNSVTSNGSANLSWNTVNYMNCLNVNIPTNLTYIYTITNLSLSQTNPTELFSSNGGVSLTESAPTCSASSFTIPIQVSVLSGAPLTFHLTINSSTSLDATINTFVGTITSTSNNTSQLTNTNYSFSGTFTQPNSSGIYSFSSSSTDPFIINYATSSEFSSGSMTITGPNETDVLKITGPGQVTVTTTISGVSKTTTETINSFMGIS